MSARTPTAGPAATSPNDGLAAGRPDSVAGLWVAMALLLATDLAGGLLVVRAGVNTWGEAWGPAALLAAPVPMILAQVLLVRLATRRPGRTAIVASGLLAVACLVSVASGFFDGGLGNAELTPGLAAFQYFLLALTAFMGLLALARGAFLVRSRG